MKKTIFIIAVLLPLSACVSGLEQWVNEDVKYSNFQKSEKYQGQKELDATVELGVGEMRVQAGDPATLYDLDLRYNAASFKPKVESHVEGDRAYLNFSMQGEGRSWRKYGKTRLDLSLNPGAALKLEARTGVGDSQIDLSGMKLDSVRLDSGVGSTKLSMLSPNPIDCRRVRVRSGVGDLKVIGLGNFRFENFEFQGGVGGATLDFSGDWETVGDVNIEVGVGGVEIKLPRDIGAEIHASKNFLSGFDFKDFTKDGNIYRSNNIDRVKKVLHFRIDSGIGGVEIRWM